MKRLLFILCLTLTVTGNGEIDTIFRLEFDKKEIYVGESLLAQFVLYSKDDILEVEVAKFPEFRGYWSENLALRQGPIALIPDFSQPGWNKIVLGAYTLTPMLGSDVVDIRPMKLVIRRPRMGALGAMDLILESDTPPMVLKPTPAWSGQPAYLGLVGRYNIYSDKNTVRFRKGEPTRVRFYVDGAGNFQELNKLPVVFPEGVTILSETSIAQGRGSSFTKIFDFTISVAPEVPSLVIPSTPLVYFEPFTETFKTAQSPEIELVELPKTPELTPEDPTAPELRPMHAFTTHSPMGQSLWFWVLHSIALALFGHFFTPFFPKLRRAAPPSPIRRAPALKQIRENLKSGKIEESMIEANRMARLCLQRFSPTEGRGCLTRSELLANASPHLSASELAELEALFRAFELLRYSRNKPSPENPAKLVTALNRFK